MNKCKYCGEETKYKFCSRECYYNNRRKKDQEAESLYFIEIKNLILQAQEDAKTPTLSYISKKMNKSKGWTSNIVNKMIEKNIIKKGYY